MQFTSIRAFLHFRKVITVASALNAAVLLTLCKLRMHKIFVTLESMLQRASLDRTAVCPLLLLWLRMCISHPSICLLEVLRTRHMWFLSSHHSSKDILVMNTTSFDSVCSPRGSRITHHVHRVEFQCKQLWICTQTPDLQLDSASTFGYCRLPTGLSALV